MQSRADPIFAHLNDEQRAAVNCLEGPLLILAGAGSGKTRALTHRIAHLMAQGVPAWQILAVTFTNKAANEMKDRIKNLLKISGENLEFDAWDGKPVKAKLPVMGTFHSICVRMLRRDIERLGRDRQFVIYDSDDQEKLMTHTLRDLRIAVEELRPRAAIAAIGGFKCEALSVGDVRAQATSRYTHRLGEVYARYQAKLREANALDFDDLILETVRLLSEHPDILTRYQNTWRFLHVDEYQDTNHAQYLFISLLARRDRNICVIGDPDQSIYAFRGADIRNILHFKQEYAEATLIKLERNYRSTQLILDAADGVIAANPNRPEKKMWTERREGAKLTLREVSDERREAEEAIRTVQSHHGSGVRLQDQAILYRTNAQSRLFEEACLKAGISYRIVGGMKFYARREVKDVLAYLFAILNPSDTLSLLRILNVPARKIGQTTIGRLQAHGSERGLTLWQSLKSIETIDGVNEATKTRLKSFASLIEKYRKRSSEVVVSELTAELLKDIGMEKFVRDDTEEGETRWENILELTSVMHKYDRVQPTASLTNFLEEVALVSEVDKLDQGNSDALTLMTLHLCKGLEFKTVIIAGCEEGIFPHSASHLDRKQLEEERRLLYVGMTRAKDHLHLMHAQSRMLWGKQQANERSRFLDDIPHEVSERKSDDVYSRYGWRSGKRADGAIAQSIRSSEHVLRATGNGNEFNQDFTNRFGFALRAQSSHGSELAAARESEFNQDAESALEFLQQNTRIAHRTFGTGTIVSRRGDMVDVKFDSGMQKKLALSIAPIKIL